MECDENKRKDQSNDNNPDIEKIFVLKVILEMKLLFNEPNKKSLEKNYKTQNLKEGINKQIEKNTKKHGKWKQNFKKSNKKFNQTTSKY